MAKEEPVNPLVSQAVTSLTSSYVGGYSTYGGTQQSITPNAQVISKNPSMGAQAQRALPTNVSTATGYAASLLADLANKGQGFSRNTQLSPSDWKRQLIRYLSSI